MSLSWSFLLPWTKLPQRSWTPNTQNRIGNCHTVSPKVSYNMIYVCLGTISHLSLVQCSSSHIQQTGIHTTDWYSLRSMRLRFELHSSFKQRLWFLCQTLLQNYTSVPLITAILVFNVLQMFLKDGNSSLLPNCTVRLFFPIKQVKELQNKYDMDGKIVWGIKMLWSKLHCTVLAYNKEYLCNTWLRCTSSVRGCNFPPHATKGKPWHVAMQNIFIIFLHLNLWVSYWYSHVSATVSIGTAPTDNSIILSTACLEIWAALLQGNAFSYILFLNLSFLVIHTI